MEAVSKQRRARYMNLRRRVGRLVGSNYDISDRCNLHCEGCLFFAGDDYKNFTPDQDVRKWGAFFQSERDRGVNFGYIAGAEPSLELERLREVHKYIRNAVIFTNGIVKIPSDIGYRIHVSLWGGEEQSITLRGAGNKKAIKNYASDPRAVFVYTISSTNIDDISGVARIIADHGGKLTFNLFSPTTDYLDEAKFLDEEDKKYFRLRDQEDIPVLSADDLRRSREEIAKVLAQFPETIMYSLPYHNWVTQAGGIYNLDPATGIATDCGNRLTEHFRHYNADLSKSEAKCCMPNIDCRDCRAYAPSLATFLTRNVNPIMLDDSADEWMDIWELWADLFLPVQNTASEATSEMAARMMQPA